VRSVWSVVALAVVVAGGCVGSIDRDEFRAEIDARGGGTSTALVVGAVDAMSTELGVTDFQVAKVVVNSQSVLFDVRDPQQPDNVDTYVYTQGRLGDPTPVRRSSSDDPLEESVFGIGAVPFDELDRILAEAYEATGVGPGATASVVVQKFGVFGDDFMFFVNVSGERSDGSARFDSTGTLISEDDQ